MDNEMEPLWLFLPDVSRYSIGWRMGAGEDYAQEWWAWFESLSTQQKSAYIAKHPEPISWTGFYNREHPGLSEELQKEIAEVQSNNVP
jgi:hypothetical protein